MATTSPDNIWTPDSGDDYALTVDLARMADDIQDALNSRAARNPAALVGLNKGTTVVPSGGFASLNTSSGVGTNLRNNGFTYGVGQILVPTPGLYSITVQVSFPANANGTQRGVRISVDGTTYIVDEPRHALTNNLLYRTLSVSGIPVNNGFEIGVRQDSGANLSVDLAFINVVRVGQS